MLRYNQPSNVGALENGGVPFWKETQSVTGVNDKTAKLASGFWIVIRDILNNPLQIVAEGLREYYLEVHSLMRARTSSAEYPRGDVESA